MTQTFSDIENRMTVRDRSDLITTLFDSVGFGQKYETWAALLLISSRDKFSTIFKAKYKIDVVFGNNIYGLHCLHIESNIFFLSTCGSRIAPTSVQNLPESFIFNVLITQNHVLTHPFLTMSQGLTSTRIPYFPSSHLMRQ